ncbi:MAG: hypothetical protein L7S56_08275 [Candidatus Poseidonia sp.]|nr:hypothetical protein [Poseidonia sp.]
MKHEALLEACEQLQISLDVVERYYGYLNELIFHLESDCELVATNLQVPNQETIPAAITSMRGTIQRELGTCLEYQLRLKQLKGYIISEVDANKIEPLLLYFSRLFASYEDTLWICEQSQQEFHTERIVHGMLPSMSLQFLGGEGQLMLAKFTRTPKNWRDLHQRMIGHLHWLNALLETMVDGHPLFYPLMLSSQATNHCQTIVTTQIKARTALLRLEDVRNQLGHQISGRVFSLEILQLQSEVCPFPIVHKEGEE